MGFSVVIYAHTKRSGFYVFYYLLERSTPQNLTKLTPIKKGAALLLFGACGRDMAGKNRAEAQKCPLEPSKCFEGITTPPRRETLSGVP